jgi:2-phospho-L-lactate/phosphoenolpyruvate guanylyltransferase
MTHSLDICAVVPVKRFSAAKRRLAPLLGTDERACLVRLMLADVLDVLRGCDDIFAEIAVVTADPAAASLAKHHGAIVVQCDDGCGINAAIERAVASLGLAGDCGLMVVPSDIPRLTRDAIAAAANAIRHSRTLAIAEAANDGGTNLLACRPMRAVTMQFGRRSFARHVLAAREAGILTTVLQQPELALDIDRADDVRTFLALRSPTRAHAYLSAIGAAARLVCVAERLPAEVTA